MDAKDAKVRKGKANIINKSDDTQDAGAGNYQIWDARASSPYSINQNQLQGVPSVHLPSCSIGGWCQSRKIAAMRSAKTVTIAASATAVVPNAQCSPAT